LQEIRLPIWQYAYCNLLQMTKAAIAMHNIFAIRKNSNYQIGLN